VTSFDALAFFDLAGTVAQNGYLIAVLVGLLTLVRLAR
jgi:hypothetical protein